MANSCWNLKSLLLLALVCQISVSQRVCRAELKSKQRVERVGPWPARAGQTVTVSCSEGWRLNSLTTTITCNDNGQWRPYWPKCLLVKCPVLSVANGILFPKRLRAGTNVTVTCSDGYVLDTPGSGVLTCLSNGTWNQPKPTCYPGCSRPHVIDKLQLRERYMLQETFRLGASVSYSCGHGYTITGGSPISRCTHTGWTDTTLRCEPKSCGSAGEIPNGQYKYTEGVEFGSKVTAECNEGYHLIGSNIRLCTSTGWDGREAVCEPVQCPPPPRVPGAVLSGSVDEPHLYNHVVSYRCPDGYLLGEREIHCTKNGNWSAPPPQCTDVTCRQPVLRFGSRTWNYKLNYKPGERVGVKCDPGTRLVGASTLTCGTDGQWDPPIPTCVWMSK